ncbi:Trp biosynthesis-associated membrane protein [Actinokineospora inagensis]|uniref:Trp biosynthesis-associated membrane protein n=1 Tax=Actinokineospora inagensis TaxID=103730 RepID=UPI0004151E26|nr:Trp biosynthesis-associated membrane protein [Actinokineospora inagensis]
MIGLLLLAAAALWGSSRLAWGQSTHVRPGTDVTVAVAVPGSTAAPALVPLAVLALAAVAGVLAVGGQWRRWLGLVVAAAGAVPVWNALFQHTDGTEFAGRAVAVVGGSLTIAAGVLLLLRGHQTPRLGGRYRSPGAARETARDEQDLWQALSEGEDPTR